MVVLPYRLILCAAHRRWRVRVDLSTGWMDAGPLRCRLPFGLPWRDDPVSDFITETCRRSSAQPLQVTILEPLLVAA